MNKLGTAIGGLLLIGALTAPVAFAHTDNGAEPVINLIPTIGLDDTTPAGQNRVSGAYYTATSLILGICEHPHAATDAPDCDPATVGTPIPGNPGSQCTNLPPAQQPACLAATSPLGPGFTFTSISGVFADIEVGGLGACSGPDVLQNEVKIDNTPGGTLDGSVGPTDALVPDGIWNDGGIGFVSHTDHYDCAPVGDGPNADGAGPNGEDWNTLGCNYTPALGDDAVSGRNVWLFTTCAWGKPVVEGGEGLDAVLFQFLGDIPNNVLGGFPQSLLDNIQYLDDCGLGDLIANALTGSPPSVCANTTTSTVCGSGAISSDNFGDGWGTAFLPAGNDDDPSTNYPSCDAFATASVFPISGAIFTAEPCDDSLLGWCIAGPADVSVASVGFIA